MAANWYRSLSDLPLYKFINCICDNDLNQLVITGQPAQGELIETWNALYIEFLDGMQDKKGVYKIKLLSRINKLEFDFELIQLCIKFLCPTETFVAYSKKVIDVLKQHIRVTGEFNPEDLEQYMKDLQVVLNRSANMHLEIEAKKAEYAVITKDGTGQVTKKQFDSLIAQVSLFSKFHINKMVLTVSEFMELYRIMQEHNEALQQQLQTQKMK